MMRKNGYYIKQVSNLKYLGRYIGSTKRDIKIRIGQPSPVSTEQHEHYLENQNVK